MSQKVCTSESFHNPARRKETELISRLVPHAYHQSKPSAHDHFQATRCLQSRLCISLRHTRIWIRAWLNALCLTPYTPRTNPKARPATPCSSPGKTTRSYTGSKLPTSTANITRYVPPCSPLANPPKSNGGRSSARFWRISRYRRGRVRRPCFWRARSLIARKTPL